jgi:Ca2+-binding RTX toxin-like protein
VNLGDGNDAIVNAGTIGGDVLLGNGDDTFTSVAGSSVGGTIHGGDGNDVYIIDNAADIIVENAGEGTDEVRTTLSNYALPANVEKLTYVGTGSFAYTGGAGNDNVTSGAGNDFLDLSQGGADVASLGGGNDAVYFGAAFGAGDRVDAGAGADTVILDGVYTGANRVTVGAGQLANIETLTLASGGAGSPAGYDIVWQDGNLASGQQLTVYAGALGAGESVKFDGSAEAHGYFIVYGGAGTDDVKGGAGSDGFYFGPGKFSQSDHVDGGGGGQNQLGLDGSYDFSATGLGTLGGNFTNIQTIILYTGDPQDTTNPYPNHYHIVTNDAAVATGQALTIYGVQLASDLVFDGSAETNGAFRILSGAGNDTITGGQGNDILYGNGGADTLTGGAGNDVFVYADTVQSSGASVDHITDFGAGDRIDLSQIDADTTQGGDQAFAFIGSGAFGHHAGELRAELANGVWTIEGDTDGDGQADFTLLVTTTGGHAITNTDFIP